MSGKKYLGIDVGGSKILAGVLSEGKVIAENRIYTGVPLSSADILIKIKEVAKDLPLSGVTAGGVTVPGIADFDKGEWVSSPFLDITNWQIARQLGDIFCVPFAAENDVNACAIAEKKYGLCKNVNDFLWITLSNGVGGALFLDGKLYRGGRGAAGEIGHVVTEENGEKCDCGSAGCLETAASGRGISNFYYKVCGKRYSAKELANMAKNGDKAAVLSFERAGRNLGAAVAAVVNMLDLDTVVVGGGVGQSLGLLTPSYEDEYNKRVFKRVNRKLKTVYTALGYDAALIGASAIAEEI